METRFFPQTAVNNQLRGRYLQRREQTLIDPLQRAMFPSRKAQTGHGRHQLSHVHGYTHIGPSVDQL